MKRLNIPLEASTTRHIERRVVWILLIAITGLILGTLLQKIWIARDSLSSLTPQHTSYSLRFEKTAKTSRILSKEQGDQLLSPLPWTLQDLISRSNREYALFFEDMQLVGVAFDATLEQKEYDFLKSAGHFVQSENSWTFIGSEPPYSEKKEQTWPVFSVLPGNHGHFSDQNGRRSFSVKKKGITIHRAGQKATIVSEASLPASATPYASLILDPGSTTLPPAVSALLPIPAHQTFLTAVQTYGARYTLAHDDKGGVIALFVPTDIFTTDELTTLARDIVSRKSLTTTALTSITGESFKEIRTNDEHLESTIRAEEDFTYITVMNQSGFTIRVTKTNAGTIFSNRDISAEVSQNNIASECLITAVSFVDLDTLEETFAPGQLIEPWFEHQLFPVFDLSELAFSRHKSRLCW